MLVGRAEEDHHVVDVLVVMWSDDRRDLWKSGQEGLQGYSACKLVWMMLSYIFYPAHKVFPVSDVFWKEHELAPVGCVFSTWNHHLYREEEMRAKTGR